jgi:hypothetical protein
MRYLGSGERAGQRADLVEVHGFLAEDEREHNEAGIVSGPVSLLLIRDFA